MSQLESFALDQEIHETSEEDVFIMPTSFGQQRFWVINQLDPNNSTYNMTPTYHITGRLNVAALEQSLNEMIQRHESLRTTFITIDDQLMQVIKPAATLPLPTTDLSYLPDEERKGKAIQIATQEAQRPFDLSEGPLIRAKLIRLSPEEHIFSLGLHHIISDGWSMSVFWRELAALYTAFSAGRPLSLPELPLQYADFAIWQREQFQGELLEQELAYWRKQLGGTLPILDLPTDRPRPAIQTYRGEQQRFTLPAALTQALKNLSRSEGVTLFMTLLAAFQTLLSRYTGQEDIIVGTPIANRNRTEIEGVIGLFINTLVLRTDLSGQPTFRELLRRAREVTLGAYAHQELPFEKVLEDIHPERQQSYTPLFQVLFVLQNTPDTKPSLPGLEMQRLGLENPIAKMDLILTMVERGENLVGSFEYNTDLFDAETITRLIGHWQTLLTSLVANPDQPITTLSLLTEVERYQLLVEWNNTQTRETHQVCIHHLFEAQVERTPGALAVVFPPVQAHSGQTLTYRELNRRANQLAHYLQELGIGPESRVGLCLERSPEMIVALLGILKAGGAYVPLDPVYPQERLAFISQDAQLALVLTQASLAARFVGEVKPVCLDMDGEMIAHYSAENPASEVKADNLAYLIYTSGSTGKPKAVMIEHRALVNFTEAASLEYKISSPDRILQFASISFDASAEEIYPCLTQGATLVLRPDSMLDSVAGFLQCCQEWGLTVLDLPTSYWHELTLGMGGLSLPESLRLVIIGGERALPERLKLWQQSVGEQVRLVNSYGPTETTVVATLCDLTKPMTIKREIPIGRPLRNLQTYILDQHLQPVPIGVPGQLHLGGASLARGYLNRPELTAEKFIHNPFKNNDELGMMKDESKPFHSSLFYKTGDLVRYLPDGNIEFLGRVDHQVKIRGFRVELGEIEAVLDQHPAVQEVVVMAREDVPGDKRLVAYIVPAGGQMLETVELRHFLAGKLPNYMVPAVFVSLASLPLTPSGKVDRRALPVPEAGQAGGPETYTPPRTSIEQGLAEIWADVLGVEQVGIQDNFFDLGGHSLSATRLVSRVRGTFQIDLPLQSIFEAQTLAELAQMIEQLNNQGMEDQLAAITPISSNRRRLK